MWCAEVESEIGREERVCTRVPSMYPRRGRSKGVYAVDSQPGRRGSELIQQRHTQPNNPPYTSPSSPPSPYKSPPSPQQYARDKPSST